MSWYYKMSLINSDNENHFSLLKIVCSVTAVKPRTTKRLDASKCEAFLDDNKMVQNDKVIFFCSLPSWSCNCCEICWGLFKKKKIYLLFSCRLVKARLTLRLLGLKFGGFWEAAALLMFQLSFVFGFTAEVVMPAMLATISIATPFPILRHVVKWQNTRDFSWRIKLALEPEEESASSCLNLAPMPHQRGVLERDFPFSKCVSLSLLCCSVACSLWQKNRCRCKFVS